MAVVVEPFDRGVLDRSVHAFDLSIRPGVTHFGQPMLDPILRERIPNIWDEKLAVGPSR